MAIRPLLAAASVLALALGAQVAVAQTGGRSVYISQIGDANVATVTQTAPNASARVDQAGSGNRAEAAQGGGTASLVVTQAGELNVVGVRQGGFGGNVLTIGQTGTGNRLTADQTASRAIGNGAILSQIGGDNRMALTQNGGDNSAMLAQNGDGNRMTAVQNDTGNRLVWTQAGSNLSDLAITQSGAAAMQITQTNGGK